MNNENYGYGCFSYAYDALNSSFPYEETAVYFDSLIKRFGAPGKLLLDLGCGTGTMTFLMEKMGYDVTGVDVSEDMLSVAMEKKIALGSNALFLCQPMEELDMFGTMDVTLSSLDSLNHLPDFAAWKRVFEKVALFSHPDGLFLFDCNTVYKHEHTLANETFVYDLEDIYCVWQNTLLPDAKVQIDLDLFSLDEDGRYFRESESFCEQAYPISAIKALLKETGFTLLGMFDGYTLAPPRGESERVVVAARRIGERSCG